MRGFQGKRVRLQSNISGRKRDINSYDVHSNSQGNVETVETQQLTQGQNPEYQYLLVYFLALCPIKLKNLLRLNPPDHMGV